MQIMPRLIVVALAIGCRGAASDSSGERGLGLGVAELNAVDQARAYEIAMRAAFQLESSLVLLLNPAHLPRKRNDIPADSVPADVVKELRKMNAIQGTCDAAAPSPKRTPICEAKMAGYEVQMSDVFQVAPDTVQLYFTAERFRPASDTLHNQAPLRLEHRYTLVRRPMGWSVAKGERVVK